MLKFEIKKKGQGLMRAGVISTPHGDIETPAIIVVGTKATVKAVPPEALKDLGAQAVLANTYHLNLQPGSNLVKKAGGLHKFMNWSGPIFTDSGGFQVFSLGGGGSKVSGLTPAPLSEGEGKHSKNPPSPSGRGLRGEAGSLVKITEDGVEFRSHIDGSKHFFTPEKSMQIQHDLGADIIFAFDECTSPMANYEYQKEALERTHRWAERSLVEHKKLGLTPAPLSEGDGKHSRNSPSLSGRGLGGEAGPALFGIVQGGRHQDLREQSAKQISGLDFDGFGIGGSFDKEDMGAVVRWVNKILPENKPRHMLGIGAVEDIFLGVENGVDTFDCVSATREARNGALYTKHGRINILNVKYREDFTNIEKDCNCYTCTHYTNAYLAHLFKAQELLVYTLASIHNLYFFVNLVKNIRQSILDDTFFEYKERFLQAYQEA